jgi:hypothetical protein
MMRNIYSSNLNKRAQFFILSAVIIASIIVSLASVKNFATTGDAPKKFYYYSQQLEDEAGAVVDYALYNDPTGDNNTVKENLNKFLQQSIDKTLEGYPDMEIFACYTNSSVTNRLICQNNGTKSIKINVSSNTFVTIPSPKFPICDEFECLPSINSISILGKNLVTVTPDGEKPYNIFIGDSAVQRGQFYFLLKMNTSDGDYIADSAGTRPI